MTLARTLVGGLSVVLCLCVPAQAAPPVIVAKTPCLVCPRTELGDAELQARYATMWERYSAEVDETTRKLREEIEKQTKSATGSGNLDLALFWKALGKEFEQQGELRWDEPPLKKSWNDRFSDASFPAEFGVAVKKASAAYKSAQQGLEKGYGELVAEFTKAEKLEEALKVRGELRELLAERPSAPEPAPAPQPRAASAKQEAGDSETIRLTLQVAADGATTVTAAAGRHVAARRERSDLGNGVWELCHLFERPNDVQPLTGSPLRKTEHIKINTDHRVLEMRPGQTTGYGSPIGSHIWYPIGFFLPVTLEMDYQLKHDGFECAVFPHHSQEKPGGSTFISLSPDAAKQGAFRFYARQMDGNSSSDIFNEVVTLRQSQTRSLSLPITNAGQDAAYTFFQISVGPVTPSARALQDEPLAAEIRSLTITGRPVPVYGIRLGEQAGAVVVEGVLPGSSAHEAGVQQGDVIRAIDGAQFANREEAMGLLRKTRCGAGWKLDVLRNQAPHTITMKWDLPAVD